MPFFINVTTKRDTIYIMKTIKILLTAILLLACSAYVSATDKVKQWNCHELSMKCKTDKNPFTEVVLTATFRNTTTGKTITVDGFYDGNDIFRVRFMPDATGMWTYSTHSSEKRMDGKTGSFECTAQDDKRKSMVSAGQDKDFIYADSTRYHPLGTTSYAWIHTGKERQEQTYASLAESGFNKLRFCIFPNESVKEDPELFPFEIKSKTKHEDGKYKGYAKYEWDFTRMNPKFFQHLDECVARLREMDIQADIILFHPYDMGRWGFDRMTMQQNELYLKYVMARLGAYSNVWWSLANEWDLVKKRTHDEWITLSEYVSKNDVYRHLCSIHGGTAVYIDYSLPCFTHCSIQDQGPLVAFEGPATIRNIYKKPVIFDEVCYEGDHESRWAQLSGEEMLERIWTGLIGGAYVTHGECFCTGTDHYTGYAFLATGGTFKGTSPERVKFTLSILEQLPASLRLADQSWDPYTASGGKGVYLRYFGNERPEEWTFDLPVRNGRFGRLTEGMKFKVEIIDTWNMTITECQDIFVTKAKNRYRMADRDNKKVRLPQKPYQLLRITDVISK